MITVSPFTVIVISCTPARPFLAADAAFSFSAGCPFSKTDTEASVPEEETGKKTEIKFLQLNLWVECTKVEHAPEYLIEQFAFIPVITLSV